MDYVITFSDVMTGVITLALGVIGFFIKRWFSGLEQKNKEIQSKIEKGNKEIQERIEKNDAKVNERIDKLEEKTVKDIQNLKQELNNMKCDISIVYLPRDDFFRAMNGVEDKIGNMDHKIDRLLLMKNEK